MLSRVVRVHAKRDLRTYLKADERSASAGCMAPDSSFAGSISQCSESGLPVRPHTFGKLPCPSYGQSGQPAGSYTSFLKYTDKRTHQTNAMATVNVGSLHSQCKSVTIFQTGSNVCTVHLRNDLLDSDSSEWLVACESLQVPLDGTRYFDGVNTELFNIRRLRHNIAEIPANTHLYQETATDVVTDFVVATAPNSLKAYSVDTAGRVRKDRFQVREIGDFIEMLVQWYQRFNALMRTQEIVPDNGVDRFNQVWDQRLARKPLLDAAGNAITDAQGNPTVIADDTKRKFEHMRVRVSASGNIQFICSTLWWSLFYIECSAYAQEIFALPAILSYYTQPVVPTFRKYVSDPLLFGGNMSSRHIDGGLGIGFFDVNDSNWMQSFSVAGERSLFASVDTRMSVALTTDLQLQRSLILVDEKEEFSYMIHESPLDNEVVVQNTISDRFHSEFHISSRSRAGNYMVKRSTDPISDWVALASDIGVRTLRLRLNIRERVFVSAGKWKIIVSPLPVESHTCWSCKLLFAKRIH